MRRATENLTLEMHANGNGTGSKASLEGQELRTFLLNLDEFQQMFHKVERRLRDARAVEVLANVDFVVDSKTDFQVEANLQPVFAALKEKGLNPEMRKDEEHSSWSAVYKDQTGAERSVGIQLVSQPEYRRFRALAKTIARFNDPPFVVIKNEHRDAQPDWIELLEYVKNEGKKDASV